MPLNRATANDSTQGKERGSKHDDGKDAGQEPELLKDRRDNRIKEPDIREDRDKEEKGINDLPLHQRLVLRVTVIEPQTECRHEEPNPIHDIHETLI